MLQVRVNVPAPAFVSRPAPALVAPENVVDVSLPPVVRPAVIVTAPSPASEPMVSANATLSVAPDDTVTAVAFGSTSLAPRVSVPPLTDVLPE